MSGFYPGRQLMGGGPASARGAGEESVVISWVRSVPRITRWYLSATLCAAIVGLVVPGLSRALSLSGAGALVLLQPWRLVTTFVLLNAPGPISFLFGLYALFMVSRSLESSNFCGDGPAYSWFLATNSSLVLVIALLCGFKACGGALAFALFQFCAQLDPGHRMGALFGIPAVFGPWVALLYCSLLRGAIDTAALAGIVVGTLHYWVTQPGVSVGWVGDPPACVRHAFETPSWWFGGGLLAPISSAATLNSHVAAAGSTGYMGAASGGGGSVPSSATARGYSWGRGQRLGEGAPGMIVDEEQGMVSAAAGSQTGYGSTKSTKSTKGVAGASGTRSSSLSSSAAAAAAANLEPAGRE